MISNNEVLEDLVGEPICMTHLQVSSYCRREVIDRDCPVMGRCETCENLQPGSCEWWGVPS